MSGTRQVSARATGRSILVLSVLALLALGFPVLAHADSSEKQYTDAPPTVPGGKAPNHSEPPANKSTAHNGGRAANEGKGHSKDSHSSEKGHLAGGGSPNPGGGGNGGGQPGAQNGGNGPSSSTPKTAGAKPASQSDSSSSPLVPILIAIAVLAAISVGTVVIRQRRRGTPGSSVSPEAS
jgi:cobalamin biosynthesis Mg chelatase CobN